MFYFLRWAGAAVAFGPPAGGVALASASPRFASYADRQFDIWWPIMTAPLFLAGCAVFILLYIAVLAYYGTGAPSLPPADADQPPNERRTVFEGNVAFDNGRDGFSLPEGFQGTLKGNTAFGNGGPGFSIGAKNEIHQAHSGEGSNIVHLGKPPFVLTPDMIADTVLKIAGRDARVMTIGDKSIGDAFRVALTQCGVNIISGKFSGHASSGSNNFAGPIEVFDMGGIVDVTLDMTK